MDTKAPARKLIHQFNPLHSPQEGQSIVLIALALIGLIAFMGLALDVGFIFARGSQLQAAIDSAALAGVTELGGWQSDPAGAETRARTKSGQFMNANGMPVTVTQSLSTPGNLKVTIDPIGATQYAITATWPVETYFLKVIGFTAPINLTRSATAAIFSLADVYASRRIEDGVVATSNQAVFGPNICVNYGDPYSPWNSPWKPGSYTYEYRIYIPPDYPSDIVRVEIFDADSHNNGNNTATMSRTRFAIGLGLDASVNGTCSNTNRMNACLIPTGELALNDSDNTYLDVINPYWFMRVDENRGSGAAPGNGGCGNPGNYNETYNTETEYQLYYFRTNPDGTIAPVILSTYTGRRDNAHDTDMRWVSPGGARSWDQTVDVPTNPGSATTFELSLSRDLANIVVDQTTQARYINVGITTVYGASENGFEIWAGPPDYVDTVPSEVNARNLYVLNNVGSHSSEGATVYASGTLPMNSNYSNRVDIPLIYVGPEFAGESIFISSFDSDSGARPPVTFFWDTIPREDWSMTFGQTGQADPDGVADGVRCRPGSCDNRWVTPPYEIIIPGNTDNCDYSNPDMENCTPFYGGRLIADYHGGTGDTYIWQISLTGLPYLIK